MSTILGICSIDTGQASTHAPQVVHSHIASADSAGVAPRYDCEKSAFAACDKPLQIENDVARREQLAHAIGGANGRAAAALGAGVEIEQVLPGEAGERVDAQLFGVFEIDLAQAGADRRQPRRVDVQGRRDHVGHLGVGGPGQKAEYQQQVRPPGRRRGPFSSRRPTSAAARPRRPGCRTATRRPTDRRSPRSASLRSKSRSPGSRRSRSG